MDSGLENGVFECPKGFSKEDVESQLYLEDLDEDSELWLVRMPSHVDPSGLENQQIDLSSDLNKISNGVNNFECISERCKMSNLSLVLPQKESRRLTTVNKTFQGSILLYDTMIEDDDIQVKIEDDIQVKIEDEGENFLEEKNQETVDNFVKPRSKKHRHSKENKAHSEDDVELPNESKTLLEDADDSFIKPKSKKHKHSKDHNTSHSKVDDLPDEPKNFLEEKEEDTVDSFVKPKSKKHKHSKEHKAAHSEDDVDLSNEPKTLEEKEEDTDNSYVKPKSKKHKHSKEHKATHSEDDGLPNEPKIFLEELTEETDDSFVKPKSKKHKHSKELKAAISESDISSRNEDSETGETRKKKSHKKKKSIVKVEPSSEVDEFPNCVSQQN